MVIKSIATWPDDCIESGICPSPWCIDIRGASSLYVRKSGSLELQSRTLIYCESRTSSPYRDPLPWTQHHKSNGINMLEECRGITESTSAYLSFPAQKVFEISKLLIIYRIPVKNPAASCGVSWLFTMSRSLVDKMLVWWLIGYVNRDDYDGS